MHFAAAAMVTSYASFCEVSRGPQVQSVGLGAGRLRVRAESGAAKERSPGRGRSGALVQRRHHDIWLIVMMEGNAACALSATAANPKTIWCDLSARRSWRFS